MKNKFLIITAVVTTSLCLMGSVTQAMIQSSNADLYSSTLDFENEKANVEKVSVRKAKSSRKVQVSQIYAQTAHNNEDGYDYLRFATAVKGNYNSISYTRSVDGLPDETQQVTSVYKGISANGEIAYSNGTDLRAAAYTSTKDCYWACYTIRFKTDTYKDADIKITINVDGEEKERTVNFEDITREYRLVGDALLDGEVFTNFGINKSKFAMGSDGLLHEVTDFEAEDATVTRSYGYLQGITTDGTNLYFIVTNNSSYTLYKYDPTTKESSKIVSGNLGGNGVDHRSLIYDNGVLYMVNKGSQVEGYGYNISKKSWAGAGKYSFANKVGEETQIVDDIAIHPVTGKYVVLSGDSFKFYDSNKAYIEGADKTLNTEFTSISGVSTKNIQVDAKYIYVLFKQNGFRGFRLGVYDWDGNFVKNVEYRNSKLYPYGSDFAVTSFCMLKDKFYFAMSGGWSSSGVGAELYTLELDKEEITSFDDQLEYTNLYGGSYSFEQINVPYRVDGNSVMQGATTDGKYIYYLYNVGQNLTGRILKYDPMTQTAVGYSQSFTLRTTTGLWSDNGNLFNYNGRIYVITDNSVMSIASSDITGNNTGLVEVDTTLPWIPTVNNTTHMLYHPIENVFYFQDSTGYIHKYSEEGALLASSKSANKVGSEYQGLTLINDKLYIIGSGNPSYEETVDDVTTNYAYDSLIVKEVFSDLTVSSEITFGLKDNLIGNAYDASKGRDSNIQNAVFFNNELYIGRLVHGSKAIGIAVGGYVFKVKFEQNYNSIDENILFGEVIEDESFVGEYSARHISNSYGGSYLQGMVEANGKIYFTSSTNKTCRVGVYDVRLNTSELSSSVITLGSDSNPNTGRLFYYNDTLWTINQAGEFLAIDMETLGLDESKSLILANLPSGVKVQDASYNELEGILVVLGTNSNLYYFNDDLELINTVTGVQTTNSRSNKSITVSDAYVYVVSSKDNEKGFGLNVYDIHGNQVKNLSITSSTLGGSSANISNVIDYKGKLIVSVLTWANTGLGGFYALDVK